MPRKSSTPEPTADLATPEREAGAATARPGMVAVFAGGKPACIALALEHGALELGRVVLEEHRCDAATVSRAHASVACDGQRWTVRDLGSKNGTFVDGERLTGQRICATPPLVRLGGVLLVAVADLGAYAGEVAEESGALLGPRLRATYREIALAARFGATLHLVGESGSGKELAARHFHASGPRPNGPFVAVNCAAVPEGVAERLLFGAVRGAYSGAATDADGYVQAADGGTLFLDEIGDLDALVQGKLLRVLETREVLALGSSHPRPVDVRLCSATHRDLRAAVAGGRFREDLYFRLGRPDVRIPPLRERREEIPWHLAREIAKLDAGLRVDAPLVESCLLRTWPGNVRELVAEARLAGQRALAAARSLCGSDDLAPNAGTAIQSARPAEPRPSDKPDDAAIRAALAANGGNVTAAARALGMHRNQLRRWLAKQPA